MEKDLLLNIKENKDLNISSKDGDSFTLDLNSTNKKDINILFQEGSYDVLVLSAENKNLFLDVKPNSNLSISFLAEGSIKQFNISAKLSENSSINLYFADFSIGEAMSTIVLNLNGNNAKAYWHLASLSSNTDNKEFNVSINHNSPFTYAQSDNYGVCKDDGKLVFSGVSNIKNGSIKSKTTQNAKIMVFDRLSHGIAKPILKIDENDVEASHAAVVGKINDEHLFYLTSRGISEQTAKELITFGYLKPILVGFKNEKIVETINNIIERRM